MVKPSRSLFVSAVFVLIAAGVAVWQYPHLPQDMPVQWNLAGRADALAPRPWGAAIPAIAIAVLALITMTVPLVSPPRATNKLLTEAFDGVMLAVQGVVLVSGVAGLLTAGGEAPSAASMVFMGLGVLLVVVGNEMGKLRRNFFVGIRTKWTLANEEVWVRTHRFGGWLFVLSGLVLTVGSILGDGRLLAPWAFLAAFLLPVVYSLFVDRRLKARDGQD